MDIRANFGNSTLYRGLIIRLVAGGPVLRTYTQYSTAVCSRPEATSDVISGAAMDPTGVKVHAKFGNSIKPFSRYTTVSLCYKQRPLRRRTPVIT